MDKYCLSIGLTIFRIFNLVDQELRSRIEELLVKAAKEDTSLKTVLDDLQQLYDKPLATPTPKKRKTDIRTLRRRRRESARRYQKERADYKRMAEGTLKEQFHKLRREVLRRAKDGHKKKGLANWEWKLSLSEWLEMWLSCPMVESGFNTKSPAWMMRGRNTTKDVQLKRIDTNKPWELSNLLIVKGKEILYDGSC